MDQGYLQTLEYEWTSAGQNKKRDQRKNAGVGSGAGKIVVDAQLTVDKMSTRDSDKHSLPKTMILG